MIIATFTITLDGNFLPLQLIYGGVTSKNLPRVEFPSSFSLSASPKHYSNEKEAITVMYDVMIPYVKTERKTLKLSEDHPSLLITGVSEVSGISVYYDPPNQRFPPPPTPPIYELRDNQLQGQ